MTSEALRPDFHADICPLRKRPRLLTGHFLSSDVISIMKSNPSTLLLPLAALSLASCANQKKEETKRPNIIFMMTDDHTTQAMSCYGGNLIQTPNMDRIANEGIRFDNCYAVNASPALHVPASSPENSAMRTALPIMQAPSTVISRHSRNYFNKPVIRLP